VSTLCRFPYSVCRPSCRGGETGQAREFERDLWLLASRRRADAVACVPTIESSLTPAGAAAVDRARTPLDHPRLPQLSCACRDKLWGADHSRPCREHRPPCARLHVHKPNQDTILPLFCHRAHAGQEAALAHAPGQHAHVFS
jgi:hypothetical protein